MRLKIQIFLFFYLSAIDFIKSQDKYMQYLPPFHSQKRRSVENSFNVTQSANAPIFISPENATILAPKVVKAPQIAASISATPGGVFFGVPPDAERRTFDLLGGGGGGGYGESEGGGLFSGKGLLSGAMSLLTGPLVSAAAAAGAAALAGGGGLVTFPNAQVNPVLQKTFVVNMAGTPPVIVQGNAHQPGASAGSASYPPSEKPAYSRYPPNGKPMYPRYPPPRMKSYRSAEPKVAESRASYRYPNSPSLPDVAAKLGIFNVLDMAKTSGLLEKLLVGGPFTIFAPSDEAFTKIPKLVLNMASKRQDLAAQMLLYHVVPDTITTKHFTNDLLLPTLASKKLRINLYQLGYKKIATVNGAVIVKPDQYLINGVIHVIDRVLFPIANGTIGTILNGENCQPFDVISPLISLAGLSEKLQEEGPFTVFVPNTESFGAVPKDQQDKIVQNASLIKELFSYHVVPGTYYGQGLTDGQWLETLSGFHVPVQVGMVTDGSSRRFDSVNGAVRIVKADIPAENGVIHIVDKLLTPFQTYFPCLQNT